MNEKQFKILSIDGGGIRGIIPAQLLSNIEKELTQESGNEVNLYDYFDLITGTSTGGIIAIALGLGMKASDMVTLYSQNANKIFGNSNSIFRKLSKAKYDISVLENLLIENFKKVSTDNTEPILDDSKTRLCIPTFDGYNGTNIIRKTKHHKDLNTDYKIKAHKIALSTSAAPTFFNPYTSLKGVKMINHIDGGVFANNPSLIGLTEALGALEIPIDNVKLLSIGTGTSNYSEQKTNKNFGMVYWLNKQRIIEMFMQTQSEAIHNYVNILGKGIGGKKENSFYYKRIQHEFNSGNSIKLDATATEDLKKLSHIGDNFYKKHGVDIINEFFQNKVKLYK